MPNYQIKRYTQDATCAVCHRPVNKLRSQCDNCHRVVCRSHRPLFTSFWQCPDCVAQQNSFTPQNSSQPTQTLYHNQGQQNQLQASNDFFNQLKTAETLCGKDDVLADKMIDGSIIDLFLHDD